METKTGMKASVNNEGMKKREERKTMLERRRRVGG
jgi:hypothetical protein